MKKKKIIINTILFALFHIIYLILMNTKADVLFETKKHISIFIIGFVSLLWFAYGLWRDTTPTFLERMESNQLYFLMQTIGIITWFMCGWKMYSDYYTTIFYLEQKFLFIITAIFLAISIEIWMRVAYTRIFMLIAKLRGYEE